MPNSATADVFVLILTTTEDYGTKMKTQTTQTIPDS